MISYLTWWHFVEQYFCTIYFCLFYWFKFYIFHWAFCFCNKKYVFNSSFVESDSPVWWVIAKWSWDMKCSWQLCINANFFSSVKFFDKFFFYAFCCRSVCEDIVLDSLFCKECFFKALRWFFRCKDIIIIFIMTATAESVCTWLSRWKKKQEK